MCAVVDWFGFADSRQNGQIADELGRPFVYVLGSDSLKHWGLDSRVVDWLCIVHCKGGLHIFLTAQDTVMSLFGLG